MPTEISEVFNRRGPSVERSQNEKRLSVDRSVDEASISELVRSQRVASSAYRGLATLDSDALATMQRPQTLTTWSVSQRNEVERQHRSPSGTYWSVRGEGSCERSGA